MKKPVKIIIAIVVVLFVLSCFKNFLIQTAIGGGVSSAIHLPVSIGSTNASFISSSIKIKNFKLKNPGGFKDRVMVDAPLLFIDFDPSSIGKPKLRFEDVQLNLKEITIVKNAKGEVNVNALKPKQKEGEKSKPVAKKPAPKFHIDRLTLTIGKVTYKDYSRGDKPQIEVFDANIHDRVFTNMEDPKAIVSVIMLEALARTSIGALANLDTSFLTDNAEDILNKGLGFAKDGAGTLEESAKGILSIFK